MPLPIAGAYVGSEDTDAYASDVWSGSERVSAVVFDEGNNWRDRGNLAPLYCSLVARALVRRPASDAAALESALDAAARALASRTGAGPEPHRAEGMLLAAVAGPHEVEVFVAGIGVAVLVRGGKVVARTTPQTLAESLVSSGRMSREEAEGHQAALMSLTGVGAVGGRTILHGTPSRTTWSVERGDAVLLMDTTLTKMTHEAAGAGSYGIAARDGFMGSFFDECKPTPPPAWWRFRSQNFAGAVLRWL